MDRVLLIINMFISCAIASAQSDSIIIDLVTIQDSPIQSTPIGETVDTLSIGVLGIDFNEVARNHNIYMKSSGNDGLSTIAMRGSSASQTVVLWNELPIASPMLGQLDYSLIAPTLMDKAKVYKGGNSSAWGSGAIGGVISFDNEDFNHTKNEIRISESIGSYGLWHQNYRLKLTKGSINTNTIVDLYKNNNNYTFKYGSNNVSDTLTNATVIRNNIYQSIGIKLTEKSDLIARYWYQNADRQIAPTYVQNHSSAYQLDNAHRFSLHYKLVGIDYLLKASSATFDERLAYYMSDSSEPSDSGFTTMISSVSLDKYISDRWGWMVAVNYQYTDADAEGYKQKTDENRTSIIAGLLYSGERLNVKILNRSVQLDSDYQLFVPSLGITYKLPLDLVWKAKINKNYRHPTLNDRFWVSGGNPHLLPEHGWSQETSLIFAKAHQKCTATLYNRRITDWIMWAPSENNTWSASNINKVWSRGMELSAHIEGYVIKDYFVATGMKYSYTKSTFEERLKLPKVDKGDQLYFTPLHTGQIYLKCGYKNTRLTYRHYLVSKSEGTRKNIDSYNVGDLNLKSNIAILDNPINWFFNVYNIWSQSYEIVDFRRMPERNITLGINITIK